MTNSCKGKGPPKTFFCAMHSLLLKIMFLNLLDEAGARPKLKLLPRSVKDPVNAIADTSNRSSIFGEAKPRDEKVFSNKKMDDISVSHCSSEIGVM